jgi:hypothetical protein
MALEASMGPEDISKAGEQTRSTHPVLSSKSMRCASSRASCLMASKMLKGEANANCRSRNSAVLAAGPEARRLAAAALAPPPLAGRQQARHQGGSPTTQPPQVHVIHNPSFCYSVLLGPLHHNTSV